MRRLIKKFSIASVAALIALGAHAEELRLAPAVPPAHPGFDPLYSSFLKYLPEETGGSLTGTLVGTEVVNLTQTKGALQASLVHIANIVPPYYPADLPNSILMADLAFLATNPYAMSAAMTDYVVNCTDCQDEFKKMGGVFLGSGSSDLYILMTTKPVRSLADLKGLRLRTGGAPYARWAETVGAAPTQVPSSEQFEQINQGVVDGSMATISDLDSYRLIDVIKYIVDLPLGTFHTISNVTVGTPTWANLTVEQRKGVARAANKSITLFTEAWGVTSPEQSRKNAKAKGIEFITPSQDIVDATDAFRLKDPEAAVRIAESQLGITNAAEKIATFREMVKKWTALLADTNGDVQAVSAKIQAEIWDKVDFSTYGL